ncbi:TetR/AcrR family transcriptional regulator [Pollutimonas bauzanensis]|jgi:AcrR family transcriptional regulator|uniref:TetR/AcrR family transcriptional regulator n=1 Tax=Pollutimonas bauzanensis TaxID=658167 RepID=UPI00333E738C
MKTKSEMRRNAIMAVALEVFRELGFEAASMSQIAARVGGSKATLYNYFSSKEELLLQAMLHSAEKHVSDMLEILQTSGALSTQLQRFVLSLLKLINSEEIIQDLRVAISVGKTSNVGRQFFELGSHRAWQEISHILGKEIAKKNLRDEDPDAMATLLRSMCEADLMRALMGAGIPMTDQEAERKATHIVDIFLRVYGNNSK